MAAAGAALLMPVLSCGRRDDSYPPPPQIVSVAMTEYRYAYDPPSTAGRIVVDARNRGRLDHELVLVRLPDGVEDIDAQLRSGRRIVVPTIARMAPRPPGRRGTFAVDLDPGRYAFICFVPDADGGQHAQRGMSAQFEVTG